MQKKCIYMLLAVCFVMSLLVYPVSAATDGGTFKENFTWSYDGDTGTLTISGTGVLTGVRTDLGDEEAYLKYSSEVRHLVIAEGITHVASNSFHYNMSFSNLESIRISDSVKTIGKAAFAGHTALKQLHLGKGMETIGNSAFAECRSLESLTLPAGVKDIETRAFSYCGIKEIIIPQSVTVIGDNAFYSCENLTRVVIPTSVTTIKYDAFTNCSRLTDVYYMGAQEQWEAINIEDTLAGGSNAPLLAAKIQYAHTHSWDAGTVTSAPGCDKEGEKICTCTECGTVGTVKIDPQHTWDSGTQNADTTVTYQCTLCSAVKTEGTPATEPPGQDQTNNTEPPKQEDTQNTEPPKQEGNSTEPPKQEQTQNTEPENTLGQPGNENATGTAPTEETVSDETEGTEATGGEDDQTTPPTETTEGIVTIGPDMVGPEQVKKSPLEGACLIAAVLLIAGGILWFWSRKKV